MSTQPAGLQHYLRHRRLYESLLVIAIATVNAVANIGVTWIEVRRNGMQTEAWELVTWEVSSHVVVLVLLPLVLAFDRRRPMRWGNLRWTLPRHLLGSIVFCVVHVSAMVGIRKLVYAANGARY